MPRSEALRIHDILAAIRAVHDDVAGTVPGALADDPRRLRSVAFSLFVIGEAAAALPDEVRSLAPEVPWALMRGMRNRIVHAYFELDPEIIWDTATSDLPALEASLTALLDRWTDSA